MPSLTVAIPLLSAAVLLALSQQVPRRLADALALVVATTVLALAVWLAWHAAERPIVYWFGGWGPRDGIAVGIAFYVDSLSAGLAALTALLSVASFLFTWKFFDSVGTLFHVLLLVFLGAMVGFCFCGDIFTLFVFFELMSAAAFALTGYKIEASALEGALNFAITNSVAAFLVLWGIGLLYARTGALNLAQLGESLADGQPDALVRMAFVLITSGFFIKGAIAPFHFWLADAHAVAPTPVCVLFSGVMVEMGLYAATRVWWTVFSGVLGDEQALLGGTWVIAGAATAMVGGVASLLQRHFKRLLALSTVSHTGILLMALGQFDSAALAGAAIYVVGHAFVKGALFLCAGIVLHRLGDVDVVKLRGKGRRLRFTAAVTIVAALGLAGMPPFSTYVGKALIDEAAARGSGEWPAIIGLIASTLTGAAVLRAAGRVFFGWGPAADEEQQSASEKEGSETKGGHRRVPWSMLGPAVALVLLAIAAGLAPEIQRHLNLQAAGFQDRAAYADAVLRDRRASPALPDTDASALEPKAIAYGCGSTALAVVLAAFLLWRRELPAPFARVARMTLTRVNDVMETLHSGRANDYVAWLVVGVALYALAVNHVLSGG